MRRSLATSASERPPSAPRARRLISSLVATLVAGWFAACDQILAADADYRGELVRRARAEGLASRREWLDLGHYRPNLLGPGHTSLIDSAGFFNAADGKVDPDAELAATLAAFFDHARPGEGRQHPQCAFPARYHWLQTVLGIDPARLPERSCPRFEAWRKAIGAEQVTLIFPAAYLNNPSSMFGHTLIRFDRRDPNEETRLLSYAVNYGAATGDDNGVRFALYGLTGGYPGTYSIMPYHQLVRKYSDIENRDIWEYQLNLDPPEVRRLVEHLWELREQYADYYFFDENCAYQLLFLLDVARPGLRLTDRFPLYAIPLDTVRAVVRTDDMLVSAVFRPSSRTRIERGLSALAAGERRLVRELAEGSLASDAPAIEQLPPARRAAVLELAAEFVTYRMRTGERPREPAAGRAWRLLAARSRIVADPAMPEVPAPAVRPDLGHRSARVALGLGARDGRLFQSLGARPGYHTLDDPAAGYGRGAEIGFLDLELRHYQGDRNLTLDRLTLVGIRSLSPWSEMARPMSWRLAGGLERYRAARSDEKGALVGALRGGAGPSFARGGGLASLMADATLAAGTDCPDACFLAVGPTLTLLWPLADWWTVWLDGRFQLLVSDELARRADLALGQTFALHRNLALEVGLLLEDDRDGLQTEWASALNWYF